MEEKKKGILSDLTEEQFQELKEIRKESDAELDAENATAVEILTTKHDALNAFLAEVEANRPPVIYEYEFIKKLLDNNGFTEDQISIVGVNGNYFMWEHTIAPIMKILEHQNAYLSDDDINLGLDFTIYGGDDFIITRVENYDSESGGFTFLSWEITILPKEYCSLDVELEPEDALDLLIPKENTFLKPILLEALKK